MKAITHLFVHDLIIQRYKTISGNRKAFQSTATVDGMFQNLTREKAQQLGIISQRAYIAYVNDEEDVRVGDRIVDRFGKSYLVKDIALKDYGINTHLECVCIDANE